MNAVDEVTYLSVALWGESARVIQRMPEHDDDRYAVLVITGTAIRYLRTGPTLAVATARLLDALRARAERHNVTLGLVGA